MARVLVSVRNFWYLKFYDSVIRALADRGHNVHVMADRGARGQTAEWTPAMEALVTSRPGISFSWTPDRVGDNFFELGYWLRRAIDYLRFLEPRFESAPVLRRRAAARAPRAVRFLLNPRWIARPATVHLVERALASVDAAITAGDHIDPLLRAEAPDVVIVTPLLTLGSAQAEVLRAAHRAGIPTAVAVGSWDHLSSKTLVRPIPDRLFVWNDTQREEAVAYHGISPDRVAVTGAQCFDEWFDRRPSRTRGDFCRELGLPEDHPILLYVCSALFEGSPSEAEFVARWVAAVRASRHDSLRRASILVRPHPKRGHEWRNVDLRAHGRVVIWPSHGAAPLMQEAKADYFDSLFHSAAVVGLNTSALIEGGILGRPIYSVLLPEFHDNQEGTLHFRYLLAVAGGLVHASRTMDQHRDDLAAGLADPVAAGARNAAFIRAFVRPRGMDRPATEVFADAVEQLTTAARGVKTNEGSAGSRVVRLLLYPLARALRGSAPDSERLWRQSRYQKKARRRAQEREAARRDKSQRSRSRKVGRRPDAARDRKETTIA